MSKFQIGEKIEIHNDILSHTTGLIIPTGTVCRIKDVKQEHHYFLYKLAEFPGEYFHELFLKKRRQ